MIHEDLEDQSLWTPLVQQQKHRIRSEQVVQPRTNCIVAIAMATEDSGDGWMEES